MYHNRYQITVFAIQRKPHTLKGQGQKMKNAITIVSYSHGARRNEKGAVIDTTFVEYLKALEPDKRFATRLDGHIKEPQEIERLVIQKLRSK